MSLVAKADLWEGSGWCECMKLLLLAMQHLLSATFSPAVSLDTAQLEFTQIVIKRFCFPGFLPVPPLPGSWEALLSL